MDGRLQDEMQRKAESSAEGWKAINRIQDPGNGVKIRQTMNISCTIQASHDHEPRCKILKRSKEPGKISATQKHYAGDDTGSPDRNPGAKHQQAEPNKSLSPILTENDD